MPQNRIQFQKGMSLDEFINQNGTESKFQEALSDIFTSSKWTYGFYFR